MSKVYIDTNVFISAISKDEKQYSVSKRFLNTILKSDSLEYSFFTSGFTLLEVVTNVRRKTRSKDKARSMAWQLKQSWKDKIQMLGFKTDSVPIFFDKLVETAIEFGIKTGDTIHSQLILDSKMDCVITWNKKDFTNLRKRMAHLKIISPLEFLEMLAKLQKIKQSTSPTKSTDDSIERWRRAGEIFPYSNK